MHSLFPGAVMSISDRLSRLHLQSTIAPALTSKVLQRFVLRFRVYLEVDVFYRLLLAVAARIEQAAVGSTCIITAVVATK